MNFPIGLQLHQVAQVYADILVQKVANFGPSEFRHSNWGGGENLFYASFDNPSASPFKTLKKSVDGWYNEVNDYDNYGNDKAQEKDVCVGKLKLLLFVRPTVY